MRVTPSWFTEAGFLRLLRNAGHLLSGGVIGSVFSFLAFMLAARMLGVEDYGRLAIIIAFATVVEKLVVFNSWQSLIRYGAPLWGDQERTADLASLLKFSWLLDLVGAVLAASIGAGAALILGAILGWQEGFTMLLIVYLATVLVNLTGMPTGVLRIAGRFRSLGYHAAFAGAIKLVFMIAAIKMGGGLATVVVALVIAIVISHASLFLLAWLQVRSAGLSLMGAGLWDMAVRFPGLKGFTVSTNLNASVHVLGREGDVLIVGALMGEVATGLYKLAKQVGAIIGRLADPLYNAIYPELSSMVADGRQNAARLLMARACILLGVVGLALGVGFAGTGRWLIEFGLGVGYLPAYPVTLVYLLGTLVSIASMPLQPMMLALGHPHRTLVVHTLSTAIHISSLIMIGILGFGVVWASGAFLLYSLVWAGLMAWFIFYSRAP